MTGNGASRWRGAFCVAPANALGRRNGPLLWLALLVVALSLAGAPSWRMYTGIRQARLNQHLGAAVEADDVDRVKLLLAAGADPNAEVPPVRRGRLSDQVLDHLLGPRLQGGLPVLILAVWRGNTPVVRALLDGGADVNVRAAPGATALMCAAMDGDEEIARLLLARRADPTARMSTGETARDLLCDGKPTLAELLGRAASAWQRQHTRSGPRT